MATDAIGDIESLLEASGVGDGEEGAGFDEKIRELVVAALAGRDMKAAAERIARSIEAAKKTLEEEKDNIGADARGTGRLWLRWPPNTDPRKDQTFHGSRAIRARGLHKSRRNCQRYRSWCFAHHQQGCTRIGTPHRGCRV
jgi:hypothetical protein